jgi:hypothetical protein
MLTVVLAWLLVVQAPPASAVSALFDQGVTWEAFLEDARAQRATWQVNAARASAPAAIVDRFRQAAGDLKLLVVSEANCSDSVQTVPYVAHVAAAAGIPLRIVRKAPAASVIEKHRTPDGRTATPTVILIRGGEDAGAWIERPAALQTWFLANADLTSAERLARKTGWYEWDRGESALAELLAVVEKTRR